MLLSYSYLNLRKGMQANEQTPLVSVIVPTYKRREKLINCLSSIRASSYENLEIVVINDDPSENLDMEVEAYGAKYFHNNEEMYVVRNRNRGAQLSNGEILFFVDDDNVLHEDTISNLVKQYVKVENIGLLGPLMLNSEHELWFWGAHANWLKLFPSPLPKNFSNDQLVHTDVIPNAYMISKELYFRIGGEDESLWYNEEFDLALRLEKEGFKNYIYTGSEITHDYGSLFRHITALRLNIIIRGMLIVERRYASTLQFLVFSVYFAGYILFYSLYRIPYSMRVKNRRDYYSALFRGLMKGIFSTSRILEKNLIRDVE